MLCQNLGRWYKGLALCNTMDFDSLRQLLPQWPALQNDAPIPSAEDAETTDSLLVPLNEDAANEDADSLYASSIAGTDTTSLKSSITRYREENGRTYHSYGSTEHWGPNDAKAQDQQDLSHNLWLLSLKGRPVSRTSGNAT